MFKIRIGRPLVTLAVGAALLVAAAPANAAAPSHTVAAPTTNATDADVLFGSYNFAYTTATDAAPVYGRSWRP